MLGSIVLRSPTPPHYVAAAAAAGRADVSRGKWSNAVCEAQGRSGASIPKLEPFSRSRIDRWIRDPPFLQKIENDLTDYCSTLEGDESYSCWRAYFELKDLEKELPREDVEKFVRQAGGIKSLIDCLHGISAMQKKKEKEAQKPALSTSEARKERPFPIPDGLPKTKEELEEEEKARMPDSPFTRLLRSKGRHPAWYTPAPDHEAY